MSSPHVATENNGVLVVPTRISSVTVFRNGALVVRQGTGRGPVEVRDLPLLFASDTLRVRPARGTVRGVEETVKLVSAEAPLPVSDEERARLLLDIAALDDEIKGCDVVLEALHGLAPELPDPQAGGDARLVDAKVFVDLVGFSGARAAEVAQRRAALVKKRRALDEERRRVDERAAAVSTPESRVLRGARFVLEELDGAAGPDGGDDVPFALEYFVPSARWVPTYALHLSQTGGQKRARLVGAALVAQATGEDWSNVELSVSTADLSRDTTLPVLSSWRIGRAQQAPLKGFRPLPNDLPSLFWGYDKGPRRAPPPPIPQGAPIPPGGVIQPSKPSPRMEAPTDEGGVFADSDVDGFESEQSSRARMSLHAAQAFEEAGTEPELAKLARDDDERSDARSYPPAPSSAMRPQASSAPMPVMADFASAAMPPAPMAKRASFGGGLTGGGGAMRGGPPAEEAPLVRAQAELPPRWRTAYMRMAGPDEGQRGSLLPLDPLVRLEWLLTAHDVDVDADDEAAGKAELWRAIGALQAAQARLEQAPLPRGTAALLGTHFQAVMKASASTDVPGDGTFYRVEVRSDEGPATHEHRAVPRESNDVWRACRLDVKGPPLPSGPLVVYEDGAFRVNARLDGSGGGKPIDVNLGVDPDVRVLGRTVHTAQAEKGLMGQTSRVEHHVKVELRSTAQTPVQVVVYDRLPVPADHVKDVVVSVLEEKPPIKRTNKDAHGIDVQGAFEWRVTIMPGATQSLELKYAIDLPAKAELEGGNRRE